MRVMGDREPHTPAATLSVGSSVCTAEWICQRGRKTDWAKRSHKTCEKPISGLSLRHRPGHFVSPLGSISWATREFEQPSRSPMRRFLTSVPPRHWGFRSLRHSSATATQRAAFNTSSPPKDRWNDTLLLVFETPKAPSDTQPAPIRSYCANCSVAGEQG